MSSPVAPFETSVAKSTYTPMVSRDTIGSDAPTSSVVAGGQSELPSWVLPVVVAGAVLVLMLIVVAVVIARSRKSTRHIDTIVVVPGDVELYDQATVTLPPDRVSHHYAAGPLIDDATSPDSVTLPGSGVYGAAPAPSDGGDSVVQYDLVQAPWR